MILNIKDDLKTFREVMSFRDVVFWKKAIKNGMDSILSNNTWVLVVLPPGYKPIECKYVF
jgi:hypothetical protein